MLSKQDELKDLPSSIIPQIINMFAQSAFLLKFHIFIGRGEWLLKDFNAFSDLNRSVPKKYTCPEMYNLLLNDCDQIDLGNGLSLWLYFLHLCI